MAINAWNQTTYKFKGILQILEKKKNSHLKNAVISSKIDFFFKKYCEVTT